MGASISSLSKVCVHAPSKLRDVDIDYTFYAVGVKEDEVDTAGNCGNMSAAVGPYAYDHNMLSHSSTRGGNVKVMINQPNTNKLIRATFSVYEGEALVDGDFTVDGVSGSGSCINLEFLDPSGSKTGKTLPIVNITDMIDGLEVSCLDVGNPCVFVRPSDLGLEHPTLPDEFSKTSDLVERIERLRHAAAVRMGLIDESQDTSRTIPKVGILWKSVTHHVLSGQELQADDTDVIIRIISDRQPHRAIPLTATVCSAAAAKMKGSIVEQCLKQPAVKLGVLTIGHSSGTIPAVASVSSEGDVESVIVFRTARRLMEGLVYYS